MKTFTGKITHEDGTTEIAIWSEDGRYLGSDGRRTDRSPHPNDIVEEDGNE